MSTYLLRRLLMTIPTLLVLTILVYVLAYLLPGNAVDAMLAGGGGNEEIDREALERELGLDVPLLVQYGRWMGFLC